MGDKRETYDVSRGDREVIEWKHQRRMMMREEYIKRLNHPQKFHVVGDESVLRYAALRATYDQFFKPSLGNIVFALGVFGSIYGLSKFLTYRQQQQEKLIRSGQVSYSERKFKFK